VEADRGRDPLALTGDGGASFKMKYKFTFLCGTDRIWIENAISESVISAECYFGAIKVRMDAAYSISWKKWKCEIDASTEVGKYIAGQLTGRAIKEFGEEGFAVEKTG